MEMPNGTVRSIYCHWDGYPKGVGSTLVEHYNDREKVESLIGLGDISSLGEQPAPVRTETHSFETPEDGITVAYHRDRGETLRPARTDSSLSDFMQSDVEEFGYVFTAYGEWLMVDGHRTVRDLTHLEAALSR